MPVVNESWLFRNNQRNYPLVDSSTREEDGGVFVLPNTALVDAQAGVPFSWIKANPNGRCWVSRAIVSPSTAEVEISFEGRGVFLRALVSSPAPFRSYELEPVGDDVGQGGFIVFGSSASNIQSALGLESLSVDAGELLASVVVPVAESPVTIGSAQGPLILAGDRGIRTEIRKIHIPSELDCVPEQYRGTDVDAITVGLEDDLEVLEEPVVSCQFPLESGVLPDDDTIPVLSINGVYPDGDGCITICLDAPAPPPEEEGDEPPPSVIAQNKDGVLAFISNNDFKDYCPVKNDRVIVYPPEERCEDCDIVDEVQEITGEFFPLYAFVHRQYIIIGFNAPVLTGTSTLNIGEGSLSIVVENGESFDDVKPEIFREGQPFRPIYDVDADCLPEGGQEPTDADPITLVRYAMAVDGEPYYIRDTRTKVSLLIQDALLTYTVSATVCDNVNEVDSEGTASNCAPVRDPFLFESEYMDGSDLAAIQRDIDDYLSGEADWLTCEDEEDG